MADMTREEANQIINDLFIYHMRTLARHMRDSLKDNPATSEDESGLSMFEIMTAVTLGTQFAMQLVSKLPHMTENMDEIMASLEEGHWVS